MGRFTKIFSPRLECGDLSPLSAGDLSPSNYEVCSTGGRRLRWGCIIILLCLLSIISRSVAAEPTEIRILELRGSVEISRSGATVWDPARTNQVLYPGDRGRTGPASEVLLQLRDLSLARFGERTEFTIQAPPPAATESVFVNFLRGVGYFFSREKPGQTRFNTRSASAAVRGTEFVIEVDDNDRMLITLLDGEVQLSNAQGSTNILSGEQGLAEPGRAPSKTAVLDVTNIIQWLLYYPGVLDPSELSFTAAEKSALETSLSAYNNGDLLQALASYPAGRTPQSKSEQTFYAGLLLSSGRVIEAQKLLDSAGDSALAEALHEMIAAVQLRPHPTNRTPATASEWLAHSYYQQKDFDLESALQSAQRATKQSPRFGFAWARLAELEFSFGHLPQTEQALDRALTLSPRNAQAHALRGFILAAQNRIADAIHSFDTAIAIDPRLGNAWLGRGLSRIRSGDKQRGLTDLQAAAALEPNRSVLRSYLGKAFANNNDLVHAEHELTFARRLDAGDPTPWLYAALFHNEANRINEAVEDLEKSIDLNENRQVYRSRLLLDQDRAVRSASLATIYQRAGMTDLSIREAARAVTFDYANHSGHQFISESFNALRDPTRFNLRYETVWFNELLLANLLAPVGAGTLSQNLTYQEYSKLFAADGLGFTSDSLIRSDNQFFQLASLFGTYRNTSFALDLDFQNNEGIRPNNKLTRIEWYTRFKQQLSPQDSVFVLTKYQDYHSGDNFQYFFPTNVRQGFTFDERQQPIALAGYHHEWSPGIHTLFLGGWLQNEQFFQDTNAPQLILFKGLQGQITADAALGFDVHYRSKFEAWTTELNQILQSERHTLSFGARFQKGEIRTRDQYDVSDPLFGGLFNMPAAGRADNADFERISGFGYYTLQPIPELSLTAGLSYDVVTFPTNFRNPPLISGSETRDRLNPKAALVWAPTREVTMRGVYTRSLGGVTLDESFRLEPTQLAGFAQSFRTLISESLVGSVSAPEYDTAGFGLDFKFPTRTYVGIIGEWLWQKVDRTVGLFDFNNFATPIVSSSTPQRLDYEEKTAGVGINQLLSDEWAIGLSYRFTRSELHSIYPSIPVFIDGTADKFDRSDLHQVNLSLLFNHPSGFFARADNNWLFQQNWSTTFTGSTPATTMPVRIRLPSETLPLVNVLLGYRFPRQYGDLSVGLLNAADRDYHLNPLNIYSELPRGRVWMARLRLVF